MNSLRTKLSRFISVDIGIFLMAMIFIASMHSFAFEDRLVLILYYLAAVGSAFALVQRRAIGLASAIVAVKTPLPLAATAPSAIRSPMSLSLLADTVATWEISLRPETGLLRS